MRVERLVAPTAETRPLASLPHAAAFDRSIADALETADTGHTVAVLAISVDYIDIVIASHGIDVGHEVLQVVAERVGNVVRVDDAVALQGDDGIAVLWSPGANPPEVQEIAARISKQFVEPIMTSAGQLPITASIGIAAARGKALSEASPRALQRQARSAVMSAQRSGRGRLAVFDRAMQEQAIESLETERQLHAALREERLSVDYQPIVSLHSGDTVGVEALARWDDAELGTISPTTFIPIAEESGLISELGQRILRAAIEQGSQWNGSQGKDSQGKDSDTPGPVISVNVSNRQLLDPQLIPMIAALLEEHQLPARQLCLEISESVVMSDVAASMTILGHMKDLGLRLAIDNFGTGYSSLSYLRRLPVDILKIDQSFVQSVYNRDDRVITKAIIDLAHTLGMTTVAEGVETHLQIEVLHALNCDMAQGFYLHGPSAAADVDFRSIDFEAPTFIENPGLQSAPATAMGPYARR